jgi:hypothetical protein
LVFGIKKRTQPGVSSATRFAVSTGVLPRRLTSSSAPQRINVATLTFGALPEVRRERQQFGENRRWSFSLSPFRLFPSPVDKRSCLG